MHRKIVLFIVLVGCLVGGLFFAWYRQTHQAPADPYAGLTLVVERTLPEEKRTQYQQRVNDLTTQIAEGEVAGTYVLDKYFDRGANYQRLGQLQLAFEDFKTVTDGDPNNETAWGNMGTLRVEMGDANGAEEYFLKSVEANPSEVEYTKLYNYWMNERKSDRFDRIGPMLEQAVLQVNSSGALYVKLGRWYMEQQQYDKAVAAYGQAAVLNPDNQAIKEELTKAIKAK